MAYIKIITERMADKFNKSSFFSLPSYDKLPQFNNSLMLINSVNALPSQSCLNIENLPQRAPLPPEEDSLAEHINIQAASNNVRKKKNGCTCKKTLCLKMYCECFSSGKKCGGDCSCSGCKNIQQFQADIQMAKTSIKEGGLRNCSLSDKRCNCRKSQCQKRYCECFNSRVGCTQACKCEGCLNKGIEFGQQIKGSSQIIKVQQKKRKNDLNVRKCGSMQDVQDVSKIYS